MSHFRAENGFLLLRAHIELCSQQFFAIGWADEPSCPDCHSTNNTVAHLFSCPTHPTELAPRESYVGDTPPGSSVPSSAICPHCRSILIFFFLNPHPPPLAVSSWASRGGGTTSSSSHPFTPHLISPVVRRLSLHSANQQQTPRNHLVLPLF